MISRARMPAVALALLFAGGAGLAACGGGGGRGAAPRTATESHVVVATSSLSELEALLLRKHSYVIGPVEGTSYYLVAVPAGVDAVEFKDDLEDELEVEGVDEDVPTDVPEGGGSTVPIFLGDDVSAIATQPALDAIGVPLAHARGYRGAGVIVAVIDTGVIAGSPALEGHIAPGGRDFVDGDDDPTDEANGIDDDKDGRIDEGVGHGTFVASLILAVAPDARILPIRALNSDAVGTASSVAQAIAYAVSMGADVINVSAGVSRELVMIDQAISNAKSTDATIVAAAGNRDLPEIDFPASESETEAVTALDASDQKAEFASYSSGVDLAAPGVDLIGALPGDVSGTARWSGTSFSTALVTGCFALLRAHDPAAPSQDLWKRLEDTALPIDALNPPFAGRLGKGRVDVGAATAP